MFKILTILGLCFVTTACAQTSDDEIMRQIEALGPDSPPTEIIIHRYPAINPHAVTMQFDFPSDCKNIREVGILTGLGRDDQSNQEIIQDFIQRAARHGANRISYEIGVSSIEEMREVLTRNSTYMMYRCD